MNSPDGLLTRDDVQAIAGNEVPRRPACLLATALLIAGSFGKAIIVAGGVVFPRRAPWSAPAIGTEGAVEALDRYTPTSGDLGLHRRGRDDS
jgi:hypothetical protein